MKNPVYLRKNYYFPLKSESAQKSLEKLEINNKNGL